MKRAFTLIELLIVVAIIAILSAIAVPNFLEAQTRAKASKGMADMRTFSTAINMYAIDWSTYPLDGAVLTNHSSIFPTRHPSDAHNLTKYAGPAITTPVAYLTAQPLDPFEPENAPQEFKWYFYSNFPQAAKWLTANTGTVPPMISSRINLFGDWLLVSSGPDRDRRDIGASSGSDVCNGFYDATNGTVSNGDIIMSQKITSIPR